MGRDWKPERRSPMDTGGSSGTSGGGGGTTKVLIFIAAIPLTAFAIVAAYFINATVS